MKLITRVKHRYNGQLWGPKVLNDANGTIVYEFQRTFKGTVVSGRQQTYLYTSEQVPYGSMLRNVTDVDGKYLFAVLGEPYDVYVHSSEPMVDVYGHVTGYRAVVRRQSPNLTAGATHF